MSKKSNLKRTHRRHKAKAYTEAKVASQHEDVLQQQQAARKAYKDAKAIHQKRVFTTGAKAVIASVAIMLMFIAGLVSWSVVRTARQRRDDQTQQEQSPSQMVSSSMVTGMGREASSDLSHRTRFRLFAKTDGGYDGKYVFGGRVSSQGIEDLLSERERLEEQWAENAEKRAASSDDRYSSADGTDSAANIADQTKASSDANRSRYTVSSSEGGQDIEVSVGADDEDAGDGDGSSAVTDEQIRKLIDSAQSSTSR